MIIRLGEYKLETRNQLIPWGALVLGVVALACSIRFCEVETRAFSIVRMIYAPLFLFAIWNLFPTVKLPPWLSSAAFPIFLLHVLVWRILGAIELATKIRCFGFLRPESLSAWGVKWAIGFGGSLMLTLMLRRMCPRFAGIVFGGR